MKQVISTKRGKQLQLPSRMFKARDLKEMQISYVENQIFFNMIKYGATFSNVDSAIKDNMCVLNYIDCSNEMFSEEKLKEVITRQLQQEGDFIIVPYFKKETEYDLATKLSVAKRLKLNTDKEIVFEIHYSISDVVMNRVVSSAKNFDYLSIFYGVHFGRNPSFVEICRKIVLFKKITGGKVFCMAIPFIFSTDRKANHSKLLPIWSLISEGWVKNWKQGRGNATIKLIDHIDLENKSLEGWLRNHALGDIVNYVNISVYSIFHSDSKTDQLRKMYTNMLIDEVLTEIRSLTPQSITPYLIQKCPDPYKMPILASYIEKIIQQQLREQKWSRQYPEKEKLLLENHLRMTFSPPHLEKELNHIAKLASNQKNVSVNDLILAIDTYRTNRE